MVQNLGVICRSVLHFKFCVPNEISCVDALKILGKAYGDAVLSKTQIYEWYKTFKEDREIIEDLDYSERILTSKTSQTSKK